MRALGIATGLLLLGLGGLKAVDLFLREDAPELLPTLAGGVELTLGLLFVAGTRLRAASLGLMVLGLVFSARTLVGGVAGVADPGCGCLGQFKLGFMAHLSLSVGLVFLGGLNALLLSSSEDPPSEVSQAPVRSGGELAGDPSA